MVDTYTSPGAHSFYTLTGNDQVTYGGPAVTGDMNAVFEFNIVVTAGGLGSSDPKLNGGGSDYVRDQDGNLYKTGDYFESGGASTMTVVKDGATYVYTMGLAQSQQFIPVDELGNATGPVIQMFTNHRFDASGIPSSIVPTGSTSYTFQEAMADNTSASASIVARQDVNNITGMGYGTQHPEVWPHGYTSGSIACLVKGTLITCLSGQIPVEQLSVGDLVETADNGSQPIRWIGSRKLDSIDLATNPKLYPVRITVGAMGYGLPEQDLLVSRQHRMAVSSALTQGECDEGEVLIAAIKLTSHPKIDVDNNMKEVEYFHILFDDHQIIYANGAPTESLYAGKEALKALTPEAYTEITALFPEFKALDYQSTAARHIPDNKTQKQLVARHVKNNKTLIEGHRHN